MQLKAVSSGYVVLKKGWEVISDTGTSLLGIPKAIADLIADGAGAVVSFSACKTTAIYLFTNAKGVFGKIPS